MANCLQKLVNPLYTGGLFHYKMLDKFFQPSRVSFYLNMILRDPNPIYETSVDRTLLLLFSFSIFSDHRSLKKESGYNSMKTKMQKFDHRSLMRPYGPKNEL